MMVFVCCSVPTLKRFGSPAIGRFVTPRSGGGFDHMLDMGMEFGVDNDRFNAKPDRPWDEDAFYDMLDALTESRWGLSDPSLWRCRFVAAPDVVRDAEATLAAYDHYAKRIRAYGMPVALVTQDGMEVSDVPWGRVDALFVGGSDEHKDGPEAAALIAEGLRRGKWVHMGRVNSVDRALYARRIGVRSIDGSSLGRYNKVQLPKILDALEAPYRHPRSWPFMQGRSPRYKRPARLPAPSPSY